jgi:hypothetical protein
MSPLKLRQKRPSKVTPRRGRDEPVRRLPIVLVGNESSKGLRISGLFRTGDNVAFARAAAALHGLVVHDRQDHVELAPGRGG